MAAKETYKRRVGELRPDHPSHRRAFVKLAAASGHALMSCASERHDGGIRND
jgi:hypothetical protein